MQSSKTLVQELKTSNTHNPYIKVGFLQNSSANRVIRLDDESGLREIFGVHHMKAYIFDDDVLLTGYQRCLSVNNSRANLSESYFTDRYDRYYLIRSAPELCDYLNELISMLMDNSFQLHYDGTLLLHKDENFKKSLMKTTFNH